MSKKLAFGMVLALTAVIFFACQAKELRTAKIELGTWKSPKPNPSIERVKANLTKAQEQFPDNPEIYHLWGRVYARENNFDEMAQAFDKCDELTDQFRAINDTIRMMEWDTLFLHTAVEAYKIKDYEATLEASKKAIICWPNEFQPYLYAADAAFRLGQNEEAYNISKKGYEQFPDTSDVAKQYVEMCMMTNKYDDAEMVLMKLKNMDPSNPSYIFSLGEIYMTRGDTAKAIEFYEQGLELAPNNLDGYLSISKLYFLVKDYAKAVTTFEQYKTLAEDLNRDDYFLYLLSLYQTEDYEKSKTELEKFTMENPDYCDAWQLLANTYLHLKMKKEAQNANAEYDKCVAN